MPNEASSFVPTPSTDHIMDLIDTGIESGRAVICVGPKGCGKSAIAAEAARRAGKGAELFSLYRDMTSRDLLVMRGTDDNGNTKWRKTPLTRAVENGTCVILDGIDKVSARYDFIHISSARTQRSRFAGWHKAQGTP